MIYLFYGSDSAKVRAKAFQWVAAARAKAPDAAYIRLSAEEITEEALQNLGGAQGLFFTKTLVLLDDPFDNADTGEAVLEQLPLLVQSENPIAILAPKLSAARAKKLLAKAEKAFVFDAPAKPARGFNSALVNALGARDRATLWKELMKAFRAGDVPEVVHRLLHWKARELMQKGSAAWKKEEARKLSLNLIDLVAESRAGDLPLGPALERFALSI